MDQVLSLAERIAERLGRVPGVEAVALGGSWARGTAHAGSDIDLGLYYRSAEPPSHHVLRELAQTLDDRHTPDLITACGAWGPWINGGGWLLIDGRHVDWLFRDLDRVEQVMAECTAGRPTCDYQAGHPHGFHSHIYLGEVHHCRPLYDPRGTVARLQGRTFPYPPRLKDALIERFLFEAQFSLGIARKGVPQADAVYVAGCLFRCVACLVQVLFALNERYFLNEKGAVPAIASFAVRPAGFPEAVGSALAQIGTTGTVMRAAIERLDGMVQAVCALCGRVPARFGFEE